MLEASNLGIGSTWVGVFDHALLKKTFNIPDFLVPVALLPLGYPADNCEPNPLHNKRFNIEHTVFYNSFDGVVPGKEHSSEH